MPTTEVIDLAARREARAEAARHGMVMVIIDVLPGNRARYRRECVVQGCRTDHDAETR